MMDWIKAYSGIVTWVSANKSKIKIRTKGGVLKCDNEGFRVGDEVMFILDPGSNRPLRILPKDIAQLKLNLIMNPINQLLIKDNDPIIEEEVNDVWDNGDSGFPIEVFSDPGSDEPGEDVAQTDPADTNPLYIEDWIDN